MAFLKKNWEKKVPLLFSGNEFVISMETNSRTTTEVDSTRSEPESNPQPLCREALGLISACWPFPEIGREKVVNDTSQIALMKFMSKSLRLLWATVKHSIITFSSEPVSKCQNVAVQGCEGTRPAAAGLIARHSLLRGEQVQITKRARWFAKSEINRRLECH